MTLQTSSATSWADLDPATPAHFNAKFVPIYTDLTALQTSTASTSLYNVKDYGADNTGTADSTTSIKAAITALGLVGGGVLYFPRGRYVVTGTLTLPSNTLVAGEGAASLLTGTMVTTTDPVFFASNKTSIRIQDLAIGGQHSWGVFLSGGSDLRVQRCLIQGGVYVDTSGGQVGGIYVENINDSLIADNILNQNGDGNNNTQNSADILAQTQVFTTTFRGNRCSSTSVVMNLALYCPYRCQIIDNTCTGAFTPSLGGFVRQGYGIMLYQTGSVSTLSAGENVTARNIVHDVQGTGIYHQGIRDSVVANNVVRNTGSIQTDTSLAVAGIAIDDVSHNCVCSGNQVSYCSVDGIQVTGPGQNQVIIGNTISNISQRGISIRGVPVDVMITGNTVFNTGRDGIAQYSSTTCYRTSIIGNSVSSISQDGVARGIAVLGLAQRWNVIGNTLNGVNGRGISDAGSATFIYGNKVEASQGLSASSDVSLAWRGSGASTMQLSYGTLDLNGSRLASVRTIGSLASSGNVLDKEWTVTIGVSAATLAIRSGVTTYLFVSSATTNV